MSTLSERIAAGLVVLDGGLATLLERHGHDLSSELWSARLLADNPEAIVRAHAEFFAAGAQVATTASYQASFDGLAAAGFDTEAAAGLMTSSVTLARRAADAHTAATGDEVFVAASVGPYGAALADGSEYRGDYGLTVEQLRAWHRRRLAVLAATVQDGVADVLACETIPSAAEAEALLAELDGTGIPAWLSITATVTDGNATTRTGESLSEIARAAADVAEIVAVGVNCVDPAQLPILLPATADAGLPVVAYPNSGEVWDARARRWVGAPTIDQVTAAEWAAAGARLLGGCCRVTPELVEVVADAARRALPGSPGDL